MCKETLSERGTEREREGEGGKEMSERASDGDLVSEREREEERVKMGENCVCTEAGGRTRELG